MNNLKLNNENKINSGFKIPDNYFEKFENTSKIEFDFIKLF